MNTEFRSDFDSDLGPIRPELIRLKSLKDVYFEISTNTELNQTFENKIKESWSKFIQDYNHSLDTNTPFSLEEWVKTYLDNVEEEIYEGMPALEFISPSLKVLVLYYLLCNLQEIQPGVFISLPRDEDNIEIENEGTLGDALNFVGSMCELYFSSYHGEIHTREQAKDLEKQYLQANKNNASAN